MRLAPAAEFAVRGVLVLAERYGTGPVNLDTVCSSRELSKQYMTKIFSSLAKSDLITPVRGKHGGYVLARPPKAISLLEVVEAVEGPLAVNFCQHNSPQCERVDCLVRPVWTRIQAFIRKELSSMTLADCLTCGVAKVSKR